ncbi:metallophosphoesterase family protein [Salipaludibacillus daqingensis]|uniref:metallophosphoesterase family protein n=1 Tax=Salipaludibacillus daqingensis TaxID=3041001 RepID=UPI0024751611|nr:metallophosphoesterase [Salipaludibacillus daqingensis]
MKALIMSDSHGWEKEVKMIVDRHRAEVDAIFHCGDSELSGNAAVLKGVETVRGNCDFGKSFPEEIVETVNGTTIFVAHGHLLNVKMTEMNLIYKGQESGAKIVCYGHTHVPAVVEEEGMVILNPGSIRLPRQYPEGTYVIAEDNDSKIHIDFYNLDGEKLSDLSKSFSKNY